MFIVTCMTYVPNLKKIGQKLRSLSWYFGQTHTQAVTDRHTLKWFYICPTPCIALDHGAIIRAPCIGQTMIMIMTITTLCCPKRIKSYKTDNYCVLKNSLTKAPLSGPLYCRMCTGGSYAPRFRRLAIPRLAFTSLLPLSLWDLYYQS